MKTRAITFTVMKLFLFCVVASSLTARLAVAQTAYSNSFETKFASSDGFESLSYPYKPMLVGNSVTLPAGSDRQLGLYLTSPSAGPMKRPQTSKLVVFLAETFSTDLVLDVDLSIGVPNDSRFDGNRPFDFTNRQKLKTIRAKAFIKAGSNRMVIPNATNELVAAALSNGAWSPSGPNSLLFFLKRADAFTETLKFAVHESGLRANLDTCVGDCPNEDFNGDGTLRVMCSGDSNTDTSWTPRWDNGVRMMSWCDGMAFLTSGLGWRVANYGAGATTVMFPGIDGDEYKTNDTARVQLLQASRADNLDLGFTTRGLPDIVVLAFGTNDLHWHAQRQFIIPAYKEARLRSEALGLRTYIALVPPTLLGDSDPVYNNIMVNSLNDEIRANFDSSEIIDFHSIISLSTDMRDWLHVGLTGQIKRTFKAFDKLVNLRD